MIFDQNVFLSSIILDGFLSEHSISILMKIVQESVHQLIPRVTISHWKFQSHRILKYVDTID